jgi:uncharacterized repeat protein (TIGR03837 family)
MRWHLYCRVVDNFGDIGVAWRLASDLAGRGESVRLALDDARALAWLAPGGAAGVALAGWHDAPESAPDVVVELFGGGLPDAALAISAGRAAAPLVVNVEHLSAEAYVERSHGLPSPRRMCGSAAFTAWYFYPGFSTATGGLLREPGLLARRRDFAGGGDGLAGLGIAARSGERLVSLFCYRNDAVAPLLRALAATPTLLLLTPGPAGDQVAAALGPTLAHGALRALRLPFLSQADFDRLLWSCDLNFVRGEDSLVRAIWAGAPFVWQLYRQEDGAHAAKLEAFLDRHLAAAPLALAVALRALFRRWNGIGSGAIDPPAAGTALAAAWSAHAGRWRDTLADQADLATRLVGFVAAKR